VVLTRA
jgi:hypothetical protein